MGEAPQELSSEIVIHHPNCGSDFQFREYDPENNLNYFQCVRCGLALRMQAFRPGDPQDQGDTEDTAEQASEPEAPAAVDVVAGADVPPGQKRSNNRRKPQPDHIR